MFFRAPCMLILNDKSLHLFLTIHGEENLCIVYYLHACICICIYIYINYHHLHHQKRHNHYFKQKLATTRKRELTNY